MNDLQRARIRRQNIQNYTNKMTEHFMDLEISSGVQDISPVKKAIDLVEELKRNKRFDEFGQLKRA